jgi:hypothetical protein
VADAKPEPSVLSFFNGKAHSDGVKVYNEHLVSKGRK